MPVALLKGLGLPLFILWLLGRVVCLALFGHSAFSIQRVALHQSIALNLVAHLVLGLSLFGPLFHERIAHLISTKRWCDRCKE